jgi:hypothetical protein
LPFVISAACGEVATFLVARALAEVVADPRTADARRTLGLVAVRRPNTKAYERTLEIATSADRVFKTPAHRPTGSSTSTFGAPEASR